MQCDGTVRPNPPTDRRGAPGARTSGSLAILLGSLLHASTAFGASADIRTSANGCADYDRERLDELLAIEAETIGAEHPARPSDVVLECRGSVVSFRVSLRDGSDTRSGMVDPGAADRASRTRLLALAISELFAQLWSRAPEAPPAVARAAPPAAERPAYATWGLRGGAALRSVLDPRAGLLGAAVGADYWLLPSIGLGLDVEGVFGNVRSEHADVGVTLVSTSVHAVAGLRVGDVALGAGPGVRLGLAKFAPQVTSANAIGHDVTGPWAGPFGLALAQWSKAGFAVYASFEIGVVTLPVVGTLNGQSAELALRGAWLAAGLGAGAAF